MVTLTKSRLTNPQELVIGRRCEHEPCVPQFGILRQRDHASTLRHEGGRLGRDQHIGLVAHLAAQPRVAPAPGLETPGDHAARQPQPGEQLVEFLRGDDRFVRELRDHGAFGLDVQFFQNKDFLFSRWFETRELAVQWAELERTAIQQATD